MVFMDQRTVTVEGEPAQVQVLISAMWQRKLFVRAESPTSLTICGPRREALDGIAMAAAFSAGDPNFADAKHNVVAATETGSTSEE